MKIVITGANGFIGTNLVRYLANKGHSITGFILKGTDSSYISPYCKHIVTGDLRKAGHDAVCKGQDAIIHLAAFVNDLGSTRNFYEINVLGTQNILKSAVNTGVKRFVFISSITVFGEKNFLPDSIPIGYSFQNNRYGASKIICEQLLSWHALHNLIETVVVRPGLIPFGPFDKLSMPPLIKVLKTGFFPLIGGGNNLISTSFTQNLCKGIELATMKKKAKNQSFQITDNELITLREFLALLSKKLGIKQPKFVSLPYQPIHRLARISEHLLGDRTLISPYRVNLSKLNKYFSSKLAEELIGYKPEFTVEQGMEQTVKWFLRNT